MRELNITECEIATGAGWVVEFGKAVFYETLIGGAKATYGLTGVAGPNGNETHNGGTSYGIGTYNTFGGLFGASGGEGDIMWAGDDFGGGGSSGAVYGLVMLS